MIETDPKSQEHLQRLSSQLSSTADTIENLRSSGIASATYNLNFSDFFSAINDLKLSDINSALKNPNFSDLVSTTNNLKRSGINSVAENLKFSDLVSVTNNLKRSGINSVVEDLKFLNTFSAVDNHNFSAIYSAINDLHLSSLSSKMNGLQSPDFFSTMQTPKTFASTSSLKNILSDTTNVLKQYQESTKLYDTETYKTAISILDANIQHAENGSAVPYGDQLVDLSDKQDILSHIEQQQDALFNFVNKQPNEQLQEEEEQDSELSSKPLLKDVSIKEIGQCLYILLSLLSSIITVLPNTIEYLTFKAKLISFTIQIIMTYVFLLPL